MKVCKACVWAKCLPLMMTLSSAHFYLQLIAPFHGHLPLLVWSQWVIRADFCGATIELSSGEHITLQTKQSGTTRREQRLAPPLGSEKHNIRCRLWCGDHKQCVRLRVKMGIVYGASHLFMSVWMSLATSTAKPDFFYHQFISQRMAGWRTVGLSVQKTLYLRRKESAHFAW